MLHPHAAVEAGPACCSEHLLEMQVLTLIDHIEGEIGIVRTHAVDNGAEIGCAVHHGAVRLGEDERRYVMLVVRRRDPHHQGTLALLGDAARFQVVDHRLDQVVHVGLALPQVELNAKRAEVPPCGLDRDVDEVAPEGPIAGPSRLELRRDRARLLQPRRIGFAGGRRHGIDLLQVLERYRALLRIGAALRRIEIREVRLPAGDLGDDLTDGQTPVAEMDVAVPRSPTSSNSRRSASPMIDARRCPHAWAWRCWVRHNRGSRSRLTCGDAEPRIVRQAVEVRREKVIRERDIHEPGPGERHPGAYHHGAPSGLCEYAPQSLVDCASGASQRQVHRSTGTGRDRPIGRRNAGVLRR